MTLQQLRALQAIVDCGMSVSRAAEALHTTQPGISKIVKSLEAELGFALFLRHANRFTGMTEQGRIALEIARRMLRDALAMRSLNDAAGDEAAGALRVGTTHIHARYALIPAVRQFVAEFPHVELSLTQAAPAEVIEAVVAGAIDLGLSTLPSRMPAEVATLPAYEISRCLIVPAGHPLLQAKGRVTLKRIAAHPFIAYHENMSSGGIVQREFQRQGIRPQVIARATDASVVKTYVGAGIGIAVTPRIAVDERRDADIRIIDTGSLFPSSAVLFSFRKDHRLPSYAQRFMKMVASSDLTAARQ